MAPTRSPLGPAETSSRRFEPSGVHRFGREFPRSGGFDHASSGSQQNAQMHFVSLPKPYWDTQVKDLRTLRVEQQVPGRTCSLEGHNLWFSPEERISINSLKLVGTEAEELCTHVAGLLAQTSGACFKLLGGTAFNHKKQEGQLPKLGWEIDVCSFSSPGGTHGPGHGHAVRHVPGMARRREVVWMVLDLLFFVASSRFQPADFCALKP